MKGSHQEAGYEIKIEVLGRPVPFQVIFEHRTGKYCLFGAAGRPSEPDDLGETLIGEFRGKYWSLFVLQRLRARPGG
ncbi:MAG: hypothetical protein ABSH01_22330 [Terriglobia bacterium]